MSNTDELLANNESYAAQFGDKGQLPLPPARKRPPSSPAWTPG